MPGTLATGECAVALQAGRGRVRQPSCGFTLLELLVVMAILVMMAGLIPLALDHTLSARRVEAAARSAAGAIREAQTQSIATGQPVGVKLALEGNGLIAGARTTSFVSGLRVTLASPDGQPIANLTLFPDGSTQSAELRVSDATHESRVRVSAITGRVWLERLK